MKLTALMLTLMLGSLAAEIHGPILQWYHSPSTSMTFHWLERDVTPGKEGKWAWGKAGFGYGDGDDTTYFAEMRNRFRSIYLRRSFDLESEPEQLTLSARYDDAIIVYLNGKEVARRGVDGSGNTIQQVEPHEAKDWETIKLNLSGIELKPIGNVIAVEVHNADLNSSDLSFNAALISSSKEQRLKVIPTGSWWNYLANDIPAQVWTETCPQAPESLSRQSGAAIGIEFREKGASTWSRAESPVRRSFGNTSTVACTCDLSDLKPDTAYEYQLLGADKRGWFQTAPLDLPKGTQFVTGGDMFHTRELLDAMNRRAGAEDPLFALLGGDLAYANGIAADRWYEWLDSWNECAVSEQGRSIPMVVAIGNHEVKGVRYVPEGAPPTSDAPYFYSLFKLPTELSNYSLQFGDSLNLVILDSGHTQDIKAQTQWLENDLKQHRSADFTFVCYHRPAWGTGVKDDAVDIQQQWSPLFEDHGVEAVFENDHHVYKRTHPIKDGKIDPKGVPYLGDGAWGTNTRKIPTDIVRNRKWLAHYGAINHLIRVTLDSDQVHYDSMKADGEIFDQFKQEPRR